MNELRVTRDVIIDLWPLYRAGEASADARALIEAFLRDDPEFAASIRDEQASRNRLVAEAPAPSPERERRILRSTKRLLKLRGFFLGSAIFLTALPLSIAGDSHGVRWMMLRDAPWLAVSLLLPAIACWVGYFRVRLRLRVAGW